MCSCDLLENSYLCGISNNYADNTRDMLYVVICLKIRTFVVSATTITSRLIHVGGCDLLENSYLCGISNNVCVWPQFRLLVVICLKIRTFVVSATTHFRHDLYWIQLWFAWKFVPLWYQQQHLQEPYLAYQCCDLLENSYLCGISNNFIFGTTFIEFVVICLKIRTFVVSATTISIEYVALILLWFAWKFVPLWYQQQHITSRFIHVRSCDLLENSYLCGISNNHIAINLYRCQVVICLKIRTFVVSATTQCYQCCSWLVLWFAWKFVPLWYQQQPL